MLSPKKIFEDESLLIVDKPTGWIVNAASTTKKQPVIQDWLEKKDFPLAKDQEHRSGIVHRLDKPTSGVLIVAKTLKSFNEIQRQFKERLVKKVYTTLSHGHLEPMEGTINIPVGRLPWNRERFGVLPGGREAYSAYKVTRRYTKASDKYSLVEVFPKTGRTHQIRIHLKHLGNPVVADEFYAGRKTAKKDLEWCPRLFLHASKITFFHPTTNEKVTYESKLPADLKGALSKLKKAN